MEFGLLGPLLVRRGDEVVAVPQAKQRTVLAALLLRPGQVVAADELIAALWSEPPASARVTVQNYVRRLRRTLDDTDRSRIRTQPRGYLIQVDPEELDTARFEGLLGSARSAARAGRWDASAASARAALALWRGPPLADVESEVLVREVPRLTEMRLQALEARIEADLHLGFHQEVAAELRGLSVAHPLREQLHAQLMLALYRSGRRPEALDAFRRARQVLVGQLAIEPGAGLRALYRQMLAGDPALTAPAAAPPAATSSAVASSAATSSAVTGSSAAAVPRQLPGAITHLTGRASELAGLTRLLGQAPVAAISGTAGVGKTALALHWAHQAADRFPDGQLYVDLRGYDPAQPLAAADALAAFLRALGLTGQDIPAGTDERADRYRRLLDGRRVLVVLDNASSAEQVRPLLPAQPGCVTIVTSRDPLTGLTGIARLPLDLLSPADALSLLRELIGARVDADPVWAATLAAQCARLPLALRVAAELAAARPVPLAELVSELTDQQRRLDRLDAGGDPRTAVRAVFSWSCRHLDSATFRAFRLAGLHPGPDLDPYAAAALAGSTPQQAAATLARLARAQLVYPVGRGRYGLHDLLRAYARDRAAVLDTEDERRAALTRLFDHYLRSAASAMDTLYPFERDRRPAIPPSAAPTPPVDDPADAQAFLDLERATLVEVVVHAASHGWPGHATRLAATLFRYLYLGGHYPEATIAFSHACRAARQSGDQAAEAAALTGLGAVAFGYSRAPEAIGHLQRALTLFRAVADVAGEARTLSNLGLANFQLGRIPQATSYYQQAAALHRETADHLGEARTLCHIGRAEIRQGHYPQALTQLHRALALAQEAADPLTQAEALIKIGMAHFHQEDDAQASDHFGRAMTLFRATGDRDGEAAVLAKTALLYLRQGDQQQAAGHLRRALDIFEQTGERSGQAEALNGLGAVALAAGNLDEAHGRLAAGLSLARQIREPYEEARAHDGLGQVCWAEGCAEGARGHWQEALDRYNSLGSSEAEQVRLRLGNADDRAALARDGP